MKPISICAYYTIDTPYEQEIEKLTKSLDILDPLVWPFMCMGVRNHGKWVLNCAQKPTVIKRFLTMTSNDLLYVDADAIFRREPTLIQELPDNVHIAATYTNQGRREILSSTVFIRNSAIGHAIVDDWIELQAIHPEKWDQKVLTTVLAGYQEYFQELPREYSKIFDTHANVKNPVIEQYQASRRFKRKVRK